MACVFRPACRVSAATRAPSNQARTCAGVATGCAAAAWRAWASAMGVTVALMGCPFGGSRGGGGMTGDVRSGAGVYRDREAVVELGPLRLQGRVGTLAVDRQPQTTLLEIGAGRAVDRQRAEAAPFGRPQHARQHAFGAAQDEIKLVAHCSAPRMRATRWTVRQARRYPASRRRPDPSSARCCGWAAPAARRWRPYRSPRAAGSGLRRPAGP